MKRIRGSQPTGTDLLMFANPFELDVLAIEPEACLGIKSAGSDTDWSGDLINDVAIMEQASDQLVKSRIVR